MFRYFLCSTKRPNIENLINHITKMGYFKTPKSKKHHRFEGELVSNSLKLITKHYNYVKTKLNLVSNSNSYFH